MLFLFFKAIKGVLNIYLKKFANALKIRLTTITGLTKSTDKEMTTVLYGKPEFCYY